MKSLQDTLTFSLKNDRREVCQSQVATFPARIFINLSRFPLNTKMKQADYEVKAQVSADCLFHSANSFS